MLRAKRKFQSLFMLLAACSCGQPTPPVDVRGRYAPLVLQAIEAASRKDEAVLRIRVDPRVMQEFLKALPDGPGECRPSHVIDLPAADRSTVRVGVDWGCHPGFWEKHWPFSDHTAYVYKADFGLSGQRIISVTQYLYE